MSTAVATINPTESALVLSAATELNPRQISFVDNYLIVRVGWKAAQLAGYKGNENQLAAIASENLRKPKILAYYNERLQSMQVSADEVLAELGEIARYPLADCALKQSPVRTADKLRALELTGKGHQLFVERVNTEVNLSDESVNQLLGKLCAVLDQARQQLPPEVEGELVDGPTTDCVDQPD